MTQTAAYANACRSGLARALLHTLSLLLIPAACAAGGTPAPAIAADPHRNAAGFFDIHVCNWPDRPLFFMALFSTLRFDDIDSVEILDPDNVRIGYMDTDKYRQIETPTAQEKRVFINHFDIPAQARDGWYEAVATLHDGSRHSARDYVIVHRMDRATAVQPPDRAEDIPLPEVMSWHAIAGAKYYQVFIRDEWEGTLVYDSGLLSEPRVHVPAGTLEPGGSYTWQVHARDMNENVLLGDFNHGSLSRRMTFSVSGD